MTQRDNAEEPSRGTWVGQEVATRLRLAEAVASGVPPRSVAEAVEHLLLALSPQAQAELKGMKETELPSCHVRLGLYIRNSFRLWGGNDELIASCVVLGGAECRHPDSASALITRAAWNRLNERPLPHGWEQSR